MTQQTTDHEIEDRRKGVRRTVTILFGVAAVFYLLSFLQGVLMK